MKWTRIIVYALLIVLAIGFLVPLGVVIANSLRSNQEIAASSLIAWPTHLTFANYPQAWSKFCMVEHCWGIQPYMLNSLTLTIPATILSTFLGALAGYSISLWRFRGDQSLAACPQRWGLGRPWGAARGVARTRCRGSHAQGS